ncbi:MAG: hypothetical protein Q9225_000134 [Loekoesia sp. 1 TL-2023]
MPNFGSRSKGCYTCRKRKVKCDEQHPQCHRCDKAGLKCEGFEHPLRVVFDPTCSAVSRKTTASKASGIQARVTPAHEVLRIDKRYQPQAMYSKDAYTSCSPPIELDLSPFQDNIQATFLVVNYLSRLEFGRKTVLDDWNTMSPLDYPSRCALEATFFGRVHQRQDICEIGSLWYGKALRKLASDLGDPEKRWSVLVLRSAVILTMHELIASHTDSWIQHAGGIGRLLEMRGPHRHQATEERRILEAARPVIVAKAIAEGKRTFLEQPDWLTIPWAPYSNKKPQVDQLVDIGCMLPGLIQERQKLSIRKRRLAKDIANNHQQVQLKLETEYHSFAATLATRCDHYLHRLRAWKGIWDSQNNPTNLPRISPIPQSNSHYPHATVSPPLTFHNLRQANQYAMYNALLCTLLAVSYELHYEASSLSTDTHSDAINDSLFLKPGLITRLTDRKDMLVERCECAKEICRSTPYHLLVEKHGYGAVYAIMFPLMTARQVFVPGGEEAKFIDSVLPFSAQILGFKVH